MKKKKLILIVSSGQSGSTLIDKVIGSNDTGVSLGEISNLNVDLKVNLDTPVYCGCTKRLTECELFTSFNSKLEADGRSLFNLSNGINLYFRPELYGKKKKIGYLPSVLMKSDVLREKNKLTVHNLEQLYDHVFDFHGAEYIVDSSKGLYRALTLYRMLKHKYEIHFVHLVRDVRAVVYSYCVKEGSDIQFVSKNDDKSLEIKFRSVRVEKNIPEEIFKNWIKTNMKIWFFTKFNNAKRTYFIRHEDYTRNPNAFLKPLFQKLGLSYTIDPQNLVNKNNHMVNGSRAKLMAKSIHAPNEKWREEIDSDIYKNYKWKEKLVNRFFGFR